MRLNKLMKEVERWSAKYQFSFQFWGEYNNNVYIMKNDVELVSYGNEKTIEDIIIKALLYIYRINKTPISKRVI